MRITFVHGWGCNAEFWNEIISLLPDHQCETIDLGFAGNAAIKVSKEKSLYVTHSLGTMWALKNCSEVMSGLVAINGFVSFKEFSSFRILKLMQHNLKTDPQQQMQQFWQMHNLPHHKDIDTERLALGLDWLMEWECSAERETLTGPIISLIGGKDKMLEIDKMQDHWQNYKTAVKEGGDHSLPISHTEWCADHIKKVADAL